MLSKNLENPVFSLKISFRWPCLHCWRVNDVPKFLRLLLNMEAEWNVPIYYTDFSFGGPRELPWLFLKENVFIYVCVSVFGYMHVCGCQRVASGYQPCMLNLNSGPHDCMPSTLSHWDISAAPFLEVNIGHLEFEGLCRGDTKENICISSSEMNSSQCLEAFLSYLFQVCLWKPFKKFCMGRQDCSATKLEFHLWDLHSGRRDSLKSCPLNSTGTPTHATCSLMSQQSFIVMIYLKSVVLVMVQYFSVYKPFFLISKSKYM